MNYFWIIILLFFGLLISLIEPKLKNRNKEFLYFLFAVGFSIFFALRSDSTHDTHVYRYLFDSVDMSQGIFTGFERYEVGFCFLIRICKIFTKDCRVFFFLVSFFAYTLWYIYIFLICNGEQNDGKRGVLSFFSPISFMVLYTSYYGLMYNAIILRACLAVPLAYISAYFLKQRRLFVSIVFFLISDSIHGSMILAIPLLIVYMLGITLRRNTCKIVFWILFLIYILGLSNYTAQFLKMITNYFHGIMPDNYIIFWINAQSMNSEISSFEISVFRLFCFFVVFLAIIAKNNSEYVEKECIISLIGLLLCALFGNISIVGRVIDTYLISSCLYFYNRNVINKNGMIKFGLNGRTVWCPFYLLLVVLSSLFFVFYCKAIIWGY